MLSQSLGHQQCSKWTSTPYRNLSIYKIIFSIFLTIYPGFAFSKYTGTSKFTFCVLVINHKSSNHSMLSNKQLQSVVTLIKNKSINPSINPSTYNYYSLNTVLCILLVNYIKYCLFIDHVSTDEGMQ
jgi:hypothetical protein